MSTVTVGLIAKSNGKKPSGKAYGKLLVHALPQVIHNTKEYERLANE